MVRGRSFPLVTGRRIGYAMCMQPAAWPEPDPQIATAIAAKYRGRRPWPLAVLIRDRLGEWLGMRISRPRSVTGAGRAGRRPGWRW